MDNLLQDETTRYPNLPQVLRIGFIVFTVVGICVAIYFIFGLAVRGLVIQDISWYYLLIAIFAGWTFLLTPLHKKHTKVPWYDYTAAALTFAISFYFFTQAYWIRQTGWVPASTFNLILAFILFLLILELGRRTAGFPYLIVIVIAGLYPLFAGAMPGLFRGIDFAFPKVISFYIFGGEGITGLPGRVVGNYLIGFLLFAAVLLSLGAGKFFLDLALVLLGRFRGGPAKVAVLASGFFGSCSGSPVSNIVATGAFTIPTMKRMGYSPSYAGAVEACASTGGALMPPVMGAVAFIMAMVLNVPYSVIIIAAAIPAILFYLALLVQVDAYAVTHELKGLPQEEIPSLKSTLKEGWPLIAGLVFLVWGLVYMRWDMKAPFYASGLLILLAFPTKGIMVTLRNLIQTIYLSGKLITQILAMILPIAIIVSAFTITGLSTSFTSGLVQLGGENMFLVFLLGGIACYLMGMIGLITAAYIFLAVTLAPALVQIGNLNVLAVHLWIIYIACLAGITPPIAVCSFTAAAIAQSRPMETAWVSFRLGIVLFFVPFFFVFKPALIFQGPILETITFFILCMLGVVILSSGLGGYLIGVGRLGFLARLSLVIAGFLFAFPEWSTTIIGGALTVFIIAIIFLRRKVMAVLRTGRR